MDFIFRFIPRLNLRFGTKYDRNDDAARFPQSPLIPSFKFSIGDSNSIPSTKSEYSIDTRIASKPPWT